MGKSAKSIHGVLGGCSRVDLDSKYFSLEALGILWYGKIQMGSEGC